MSPMINETPAQHYGELVIYVLCWVVWIGMGIAVFRRWFTPDQGRLLYFLMFVMAVMVIGGYLSQPSAQSERASPARISPADKALQALAPVEPSPLQP